MAISKSKCATALVTSAMLVLSAGLAACHAHPASDKAVAPTSDTAKQQRRKLGLMTSLPIYWPLDADLGMLASGGAQVPWQREVLERQYELVALDTLSPIANLDPDAAPIDPLAELEFLAVIQPRVLTPNDNVALDDWVRAGGRLLLVLDPALDGHYSLPLGDPRRPIEAALIPPVVERWGLEVRFDETQNAAGEVQLGDVFLPLRLAGTVQESARSDGACTVIADAAAAQCTLGEGQVTLFADAEVFKDGHADIHGHDGSDHRASDHRDNMAEGDLRIPAIQALVAIAFEKL